jgi:hypothetical protein
MAKIGHKYDMAVEYKKRRWNPQSKRWSRMGKGWSRMGKGKQWDRGHGVVEDGEEGSSRPGPNHRSRTRLATQILLGLLPMSSNANNVG